ncbi:MAG: restriction endonuclease subunit S [Candidatus Aminicenantes bacterium]|nr:restriction endonuclease subunit S [Candidatus Aminicenantes bacterium]
MLGVERRRFRPYPEYKDSGVEWLGKIPAHWDIARIKEQFCIVNGSTPSSSVPSFWDGDIVWATPDDLGELRVSRLGDSRRKITEEGYKSCGTSIVPKGSIVISTRAPIGYVAIAATNLCTNQGCKSLVSKRPLSTGFFYYQLSSAKNELESRGEGSTFKEISKDKLGLIILTKPLEPDQHSIAFFLDCETAKIDALIEKKLRLIELLQEKRTALITQVVTKGLDPTVHMKDSGVEWLGDIPAHWMVKRLWHLTPSDRRIMYGIVLPGPNVDAGVPIVKGGDVSLERLRIDKLNRTTFEIESGYVRSRLRGGDLVYAIRGSIGEAAIVPEELTGANLTQDAARISYTPATYGAWLLYMLKSAVTFAQLEAGALGATIKGINIRDLKRAIVPVPPRIEQQAIASYLEASTARIDALIGEIGEVITRLNEYRTALIFEAVTGKIDIRTGHLLDEGPGYLSA